MIKFKSISEQRLCFAFDKVQEVIMEYEGLKGNQIKVIPQARKKQAKVGDDNKVVDRYRQYVKSMAMLILNSGLVSALLFAQGKANKGKEEGQAYSLLIGHLTEWLKDQGYTSNETESMAIGWLYNQNSHDIRRATLEAVKFLEDLKKVSDARLYKTEKD